MKYRGFEFVWYDLWVGFYLDIEQRTLYFNPLPCCVFKWYFPYKEHRGLHQCHADADGDCDWKLCPQERDGRKDYRSRCPLARKYEEI